MQEVQLHSSIINLFAEPVQGEMGAPLPSSLAAWSQQLCLDLSVGSASASQGVLHLSVWFVCLFVYFFNLIVTVQSRSQIGGFHTVVVDLPDEVPGGQGYTSIFSSLLSYLKGDKTCKSIN